MAITPGTRVGPYEMLSALGSGGMGDVWKARDTRLDRVVAIKSCKQGFSDCFLREARAVASLNHPNICTLYDVGSDYLVMEYIEGVSPRGPLSPAEALRLALGIASALEAAHAQGITHRDLKPSNMLVTATGIKLLDFGLAVVDGNAGRESADTATMLTAVGTVVGTVAYMSPEQARGEHVDGRSDIFSFGAVLYELVSGRLAFPGSSAADTMAAIMRDEPEALEAPSALSAIVTRCLRKAPANRFQTMSEVRTALEQATGEQQTPGRADTRPSIAVLPFANVGGDPEQDFLADGLTEDIITGLSRVSGLFVIARSSAFAYKGQAVAVTTVARDLGVRYVLQGSVRRSGHRVRISSQLVDATTGHHVWAEKYDREMIELFDLQDEITRSVVATTQTQILLAEGSPLHGHNRPDITIWGLVSRAMARIYELTPESLADARQLAEQALTIDARYGPAWRCLSIAFYHQAHMLVAADYDATLSKALEAAERSIQLDSGDEYAHWNLGNVLGALRHHDRGIAELERAVEINPNYSTAWGSLGNILSYAGRPSEGITNNEIAIRFDPLNPSIFFRYSGLALGHYLTGDYKRAAEWAKKSIQRNRNWYLGHVYFIAALAQLELIDEARRALQEYLDLFPNASISQLRRLPFKNAGDFEHLSTGLRKARLSE